MSEPTKEEEEVVETENPENPDPEVCQIIHKILHTFSFISI